MGMAQLQGTTTKKTIPLFQNKTTSEEKVTKPVRESLVGRGIALLDLFSLIKEPSEQVTTRAQKQGLPPAL
jgi:hypothetical protein